MRRKDYFSEDAVRLANVSGYSKRSAKYLMAIAKKAGFDPLTATDEDVKEFYNNHRLRVAAEIKARFAKRRESSFSMTAEAMALGVTKGSIYAAAKRRGISPRQEIERRKLGEQSGRLQRRVNRGRTPDREKSLSDIAASIGMSRQGIYKAAKRNGWSVDDEIGHRIALKEKAERESVDAFANGERKDVGKNTVHEMGSEEAKHNVIDLLLSLGAAPKDELIGHVARSLAMLASRTRMSHQLFLSFVKGDGVAAVEPMTFAVVESVPLMSHISPKEKASSIVALAVAYRVVMSQRLADVMLMAMATINHPSAMKGLEVLKAYFHEVGVEPSEDVLRDVKTTLLLCDGSP